MVRKPIVNGTNSSLPPIPVKAPIVEGSLRERVVEAIRAVPFHFETRTVIEGFEVGDLFSVNSVLGGSIEIQAVKALNDMRNVWDPENEYDGYGFARFPQTFPDVRLVNRKDTSARPLLGIELKGWYLLSKEKMPSYRYEVTADACAEDDLLVVVPWHLSEVLSGTPVVLDPYVEEAHYAALMRNYYWEHMRDTKSGSSEIKSPPKVHPYPMSKTKISDKAVDDSGHNFGRLARVPGLMKEYVDTMLDTSVSGVPAREWIEFFRRATDSELPGYRGDDYLEGTLFDPDMD